MDLTRKHNLIAVAAVLSLLAAPAAAQTSGRSDGGWQFSITPYFWAPTINTTLRFNAPPGFTGNPTVEKDPDDYLKNLDMALLLSAEARKGPWAFFTDVVYLDLGSSSGQVKNVTGPGGTEIPINVGTQVGLKSVVWELAASYSLSRSDKASFEVLGGFRYLGIDSSVSWQLAGPLGQFPQAGNFSQKEELWDAIVGVRGKAKLGDGNWFVPWYLDAGAGDSKLTWQAMAGIGYTFKWGDVLLAYRHLSYEQDSDKHVQEMEFSGPALGVTFRF